MTSPIAKPFWATTARVTILVALFSSNAIGQSISLVGQLNQPHGGPGPNYGFYYASCWGYVAPDGHEYALLGCYSGISIINLDVNPVQEVAYIPGANSEWKEMKTWGQYAYIVADVSGSQGLQIVNLSQLPDTAWLVRSITSLGGKNITRNHTITVADGYLYLNGTTAGGQTGGSIILSLADPENPTYVGQYQPAYLHDVFVRNDTLYGAAIYGQGVFVASVTNKAGPVQLGNLTYPNAGTHNTWVSTNGRYVFTTDEIGTTQKNMKVFDIQGLPLFTQLTPFTANPTAIIHNAHGRGNYVYMAHYAAGVYVADIHDPTAIVNAGTYDTYLGPSTGYIGCWGVYPYFPSGRWIASDTQTGLYVFTFNQLAPRLRSPLIAPADGDTVLGATTTFFQWRSAATQAEDPHYYEIRVLGSGVDTVIRTHDTTFAMTDYPGFQQGETYSWDLRIKDEFTTVTSPDTFSFYYRALPSAPTLISPYDGSAGEPLMVTLQWNTSSSSLSYRVQVSIDSLFGSMVLDDSTVTDTLKQVDALENSTLYYWRVNAKNAGGTSPWSKRWSFETTEEVTRQYGFSSGWNMLSVPLIVDDGSTTSLFPTANSNAFAYDPGTGYSVEDTLLNGVGYWLKFPSAQLVSITGLPLTADTIEVVPGWNVIGSINDSVATSTIIEIPPGIVQSPYFKFTSAGGYQQSSVIGPDEAAWVKIGGSGGQLVLVPQETVMHIQGEKHLGQ